jgi:hypothetical protein
MKPARVCATQAAPLQACLTTEYTVMNQINVQNFIRQTEQYLDANEDQLSPQELENIFALYQDLNDELNRQQALLDLYH